MSDRHMEATILDVLLEQFPDAGIGDIEVVPDRDGDGEKVLRIMVILEGKPSGFNKENLVEAVRHVVARLTAEGRNEFPILSFIAKNEAGKLKKNRFVTA